MVIRKIIGGKSGEEVEEIVELESIELKKDAHMYVKIITLYEFGDVERVQNELREGNIVWLRIKPLKDKDMIELKRAIDRIKKTIHAINGDIAGVDEDYIILTPEGVKISRS